MKLRHLLLTTAFALIATFSMAQTSLDEIINKHLAALGGADNLRKINTMVMKGNINQGAVKIPITLTAINGKAMKVEFTFNGMSGYQILTDKEGWNFNPFMGQTAPERMTEDDIKKSKDDLDFVDEFLDYKEKGRKVEDLGSEEIEGTDTYKIKVTMPGGKDKTVYISKTDYLTIRTTEKAEVNGKEMENSTDFSNYKKVGDVVLAHSINSVQGPMEIDTIELNTKIDESIFKPKQ